MNSLKAFWIGVKDGWQQPIELSMGMSYDYERLNEVYDHGANLGQWLGRIFNLAAQ